MTVLAHTLDGCMRIRALSSKRGVVELRSHLYPGSWSWCVYRSLPIAEAWELFHGQAYHHVDPNRFFQPLVSPGL